MKYFIRSLKYFCYLILILAVIIAALVLTGFVEADLSKMFVHGYDSLWQMALVMLVFALIYPRFGFSRRTVQLNGSPEEVRPGVLRVMEGLGYVPEDAPERLLRRSRIRADCQRHGASPPQNQALFRFLRRLRRVTEKVRRPLCEIRL